MITVSKNVRRVQWIQEDAKVNLAMQTQQNTLTSTISTELNAINLFFLAVTWGKASASNSLL